MSTQYICNQCNHFRNLDMKCLLVAQDRTIYTNTTLATSVVQDRQILAISQPQERVFLIEICCFDGQPVKELERRIVEPDHGRYTGIVYHYTVGTLLDCFWLKVQAVLYALLSKVCRCDSTVLSLSTILLICNPAALIENLK